MKPSRLVSLLLVVIALTVAACGGGDSSSGGGGDSGAAALLKDTFGNGHPIRSGRVDATVDVRLNGLASLSTPIDLHLSGPFQSNGGTKLPDFALDVDFAGQQPVTLGAVFAQGGGYLSIEGQAFDVGKDLYNAFKKGYEGAKKDAASKAKSDDTSSLSALGVQPIRWLKDPKKVGEEDVAGTRTVHVTSGVDVDKLLGDLSTLLGKAKSVTAAGGAATGTSVPTQLTAQQREVIARSITSAKVDVWAGAQDHTLRKATVAVQVKVPDDLKDQANGLTDGHVNLSITLAQLNQAQKILKPADARPIAQLRIALSQLGASSGGATGATATAPSSTQTATTPSAATPAPDPQSEYQSCIVDAGSDLAKVQDCARYLSK